MCKITLNLPVRNINFEHVPTLHFFLRYLLYISLLMSEYNGYLVFQEKQDVKQYIFSLLPAYIN